MLTKLFKLQYLDLRSLERAQKFSWTPWFKDNRPVVDSPVMGHLFSKCAKFSKKPTFVTPWYALTCAYQEVRSVNSSEYFGYVPNGWSLTEKFTDDESHR